MKRLTTNPSSSITHILWFFLLLITSCDSTRVFEGYKDFESKTWLAQEIISFNFVISESNQSYNLYYNIRNTLSYPYYNLYIVYELVDAGGKVLEKKMLEGNLMHPQTGEPLGSSAGGGVFDTQFPILTSYQFTKIGTYQIRLRQYMRMDKLPEIVAVGLRVEKTE
jgi:gliding motility-associated lipoprotein GldH